MNEMKFERQNGGVPKKLPGEDHISGFIAYVSDLPSGFSETNRIQAISTIEKAEGLGITADAQEWATRVLHYQLSEIYRINPGINLYVGLFAKPAGAYSFTEVKTIQNFASGRIRQAAVYCGDVPLTEDSLVALKGVGDTLEAQDAPLSIFYAPKVIGVAALPSVIAGANKQRVSVVIGQAGSGVGADLYADEANANGDSVSGIGVVLGLVSKAKVHQSIGWVGQFPTGVTLPAFGDGSLLRDLDDAVVTALDTARYLFFRTYSGFSDSYMNDSHTMDSATSDYAMIENVRAMDKAVRGIRTYLLPELGSNLYVDPKTGQMQPYTVAHLQTVAGKQLEDMEKAGEFSGYVVEIDPDQNVQSTSEVEFVIKPVGVGVMRKARVKIGYVPNV